MARRNVLHPTENLARSRAENLLEAGRNRLQHGAQKVRE
jgi:hypothetical protein